MLLLVYYECIIITKPSSQPHVGVDVYFGFLLKLWWKPKLELEGSAQTLVGQSSQCSYYHWEVFGLHLLHMFMLFLKLLVLLYLFVLRLADVTVSGDWHINLNCSLQLQVNHSQRLLADGQFTSHVSMALYAWGVVVTGKRPTHESKFQICKVLEEIHRSFT